MAYRVSISGIDGCGKTTSLNQVVDHYAKEVTVAILGRPMYIQRGSEKSYIAKGLNDISDKTHMFFDKLNFRLGIGVLHVSYEVVQELILSQLLTNRYNPSLILIDRDPILDSAVYSTYYLPLTKHISSELRLKLAKYVLHKDYPNLLLFMTLPIETALGRIDKKLIEQQYDGNSKGKKIKHLHENAEDLIEISKYFEECLSILIGKGVNIKAIGAQQEQEVVVNELIRNIDDVIK